MGAAASTALILYNVPAHISTSAQVSVWWCISGSGGDCNSITQFLHGCHLAVWATSAVCNQAADAQLHEQQCRGVGCNWLWHWAFISILYYCFNSWAGENYRELSLMKIDGRRKMGSFQVREEWFPEYGEQANPPGQQQSGRAALTSLFAL